MKSHYTLTGCTAPGRCCFSVYYSILYFAVDHQLLTTLTCCLRRTWSAAAYFILHEQLKGKGSVVIVKETKGNRECWMTSNDKGSIPGTNSRCPSATKSPDACLSKVYPYDAHSTYYISQCDCHFLQSSGALNVPMRKVSGWAATVMRHVFGH